jgi:hypothetical protein
MVLYWQPFQRFLEITPLTRDFMKIRKPLKRFPHNKAVLSPQAEAWGELEVESR